MIARSHPARSGITLTEILISILIMGIGLISLATLFPLGLVRLRDAARYQRGGMLAQSATDDMDAKILLLKQSFTQTWYGSQDPFTTDASIGTFPTGGPVSTVSTAVPQPGLPICYDPLWRAVTNVVPFNDQLFDKTLDYAATYRSTAAEARFGAGLVIDTAGIGHNAFNLADSTAAAHGLQRITNFIPWSSNLATYQYPFTYQNPNSTAFPFYLQPKDVAGDTFTSIDDVVFNSPDGGIKSPSPLLPDLNLTPGVFAPTNDWRYTWFFTGRQVDSTNGTMFQGDMVICDGRPFAFAPIPTFPTTAVPAGETVVEAIFGYSTNISSFNVINAPYPNVYFANGSSRTVLLRWPTTIPDPQVRSGGWIADVTYQRDFKTSGDSVSSTSLPYQRCYWYQVVKRNDPQPDSVSGYRTMIVTINTPVRAKSPMNSSAASYKGLTNVALIMPSVINVYPRSFTINPQSLTVQ